MRVRRRDGGGRKRTELLDDPGPGEPPPCPVAAVVLLGERGEELEVEPLEPARALALLTPNLIHSGGRASIAAAFGRLATLLGTVPALQRLAAGRSRRAARRRAEVSRRDARSMARLRRQGSIHPERGEMSETSPTPYEAPSVEEIDTDGYPISTAAGEASLVESASPYEPERRETNRAARSSAAARRS